MKKMMKKSTLNCLILSGAALLSHELSAMDWVATLADAANKASNLPWAEIGEYALNNAGNAAKMVSDATNNAGQRAQEWIVSQRERIERDAQEQLDARDRIIRNGYSTAAEVATAEQEKLEIIRKKDADLANLDNNVARVAEGIAKHAPAAAQMAAEAAPAVVQKIAEVAPAAVQKVSEVARDAVQQHAAAEGQKFAQDAVQRAAVEVQRLTQNLQDLPWANIAARFGDGLTQAAAGTLGVAGKVAIKASEKMREVNRAQKERIEREALVQLARCDETIARNASSEEKEAAEAQKLTIIATRNAALAALEKEATDLANVIMTSAVTVRNGLVVMDSMLELAKEENKEVSAESGDSSNNSADPRNDNNK